MKNNKNKIYETNIRKAYGIIISLISIILSLSLAKVWKYDYLILLPRAITWFLCFFFGSAFTYIIYLFIFLIGIYLILSKEKNSDLKIDWTYFIGGLLIFIGGSIILSNLMSKTVTENGNSYINFSNFSDIFFNNIIKTQNKLAINFDKNCGIIGLSITACLNTLLNSVFSYIIGTIILIGGIFISLVKPLIKLHKKVSEFSNFNHAYDPEGEYTAAKDITITTKAINTLDDIDDLDIQVDKISSNDNIKKVDKNDINNEIKEENNLYNDFNNNYDNLLNKSLSKAKYEEDNIVKQPVYNDSYLKEENLESKNSFSSYTDNKEKRSLFKDVKKDDIAYDLNKPKPIIENIVDKEVKKTGKIKNYVYKLPSINLLETREALEVEEKNRQIAESRKTGINVILENLNIKARVISYKIGPSVTRYDIQTDKSESIRGFDKYIDDICIKLGGVPNARFTPIVLGKPTSGLEIANSKTTMVNFKDCIISLNNLPKTKPTSIPFGRDINNELLVVDLQEMPHLLVSGTTGSGKSIFVHTLLMTLLMRNTADQLKIVLIDPKTVEFTKYREIPHLMCPPIGIEDPELPYNILKKICEMMDERYKLFAEHDVSKLKEYNEWARNNNEKELPVIVIVIDEYADLVDLNKKISEPVVRIGQKARAAGIHMVVATQRPSVNVINGVIKANIPTRVALLSSSYTDSNTIIDCGGAEKLIGYGDMLIKCPILSNMSVLRCQGAFVDNSEIKAVCDYLRSNYGTDYDNELMDIINKPIPEDTTTIEVTKESRYGNEEEIYKDIKEMVMALDYISISKIQSSCGMGFQKASRMFKRLQSEGIVSSDSEKNSAKGSKVLVHGNNRMLNEESNFNGTIEQTSFIKKKL